MNNLHHHHRPRPHPKASVPSSISHDHTSGPTSSSSRTVLLTALNLAREAVQLDSSNDVHGALEKYNESVWLLREILERIRLESLQDEDGDEDMYMEGGEIRNGQRGSSNNARSPRTGRQYETVEERREEEGKIQDILDTYIVRIGVLRTICGRYNARTTRDSLPMPTSYS